MCAWDCTFKDTISFPLFYSECTTINFLFPHDRSNVVSWWADCLSCRSRRRKLVIVLLLCIIQQLGRLFIALLSLRVLLDFFQVGRVGERTLLGHGEPALGARARQASVQPGNDVGEQLGQVNPGQDGDIRPAQHRDVGDGVLAATRASQVVTVGEAGVEDAVEPLRLADVALDAVGDFFFSEAEEVVGLTLPIYGGLFVSMEGSKTKKKNTK